MIKNISPSTNSGKPIEPNDRAKPISMAAMNAPTMDPMPPMTVTMKLSIRIDNPMPGVSVRIGAAKAPAKPASRLPAPNTPA